MGLVDIAVVLGVLIGFGYIIMTKMTKTNPRATEILKSFFPGRLTHEQTTPLPQDRIEPIYREKRSIF